MTKGEHDKGGIWQRVLRYILGLIIMAYIFQKNYYQYF